MILGGGSLRPETLGPLVSQSILVLFVVSTGLFVAGMTAKWSRRASAVVPIQAPIPWVGRLLCALVPTSFSLVWLADSGEPAAAWISGVLPWLVIALAIALGRGWRTFSNPWRKFASMVRGRQWSADPIAYHALSPIVFALLLSIAVPNR